MTVAVAPSRKKKPGKPKGRTPSQHEKLQPELINQDFDHNKIVLDILGRNRKFDRDFAESVLDVRGRETMSGAPTVDIIIHDPDYELLESDVLFVADKDGDRELRVIDIEIDPDRWYRLVKVGGQPASAGRGLDLTLTFEHRTVQRLKAHNKPKKAARARMTRAEFIRTFAREVKHEQVRYVSPELHKEQPIAKAKDRKDKKEKDADRKPGLDPDVKLTVKGAAANPSQMRLMERVLDVAESLDAPRHAKLAVIVSCIVESQFANLAGGDEDSEGILQIRVGLHGRTLARDVEASVHRFLTKGFTGAGGAIELAKGNLGPAAIAQKVQGSGNPGAYSTWMPEAVKILKAYAGVDHDGTVSITKTYRFSRGIDGKRENSWTAAQRLATEVNWRLFVTGRHSLFFVSETTLMKSRPRMKIDRGHPAIMEPPSIDLDKGKRLNSITFRVRMKRWTAPPGTVVNVEGYGPADGRWLVENIEWSKFTKEATVDLKQPSKPKKEPAPEVVEKSFGSDAADGEGGKVGTLYAICTKFTGGYKYGGGHGPSLDGINYGDDLDCSSSTSKALHDAGLFDSDVAWTSGVFASRYRKPGKGKGYTVWANSGHVWIEFHNMGKYKRFDTSAQGSGGSGPRMRTTERSTAGFTARHTDGF